MAYYSFGEVARINELPKNRLKRWQQAGIITPALAVGDSDRRYSFRNLIEARVCDELRGLGVNEEGLRQAVQNLNGVWNQPEAPINRRPDAPHYRDAPILWCAFQRHEMPSGDDTEGVCTYPVDAADLVSRLTTGEADGSGVAESGIAIPIGRIVADLEMRCQDTLEFGPVPPVPAPPTLQQDLDRINEQITAKMAAAVGAALMAATAGQPAEVATKMTADAIAAFTAAMKAEQ